MITAFQFSFCFHHFKRGLSFRLGSLSWYYGIANRLLSGVKAPQRDPRLVIFSSLEEYLQLNS